MLKNGTGVLLLPVSPCDRQCILDGFEQLSDRSRYSRYHTPMRSLPDGYVDCLTGADNYTNVVVAAQLDQEGVQVGIGLARYVRLQAEPGVAEFSITVVDAYQNQGLGTLLLEYLLQHARENQLSLLRGYVLPGNEAMVRMLKRYDARKSNESDGTLCFEMNPAESAYINSVIV